MADHTRRERSEHWKEYVLRQPTTWTEVSKVFACIQQELVDVQVSDDSVVVEANEEEIIFRFKADGTAAWPK